MTDVISIDFGETLDISFSAKLHSQLKNDTKKNSNVKFVTSDLIRIDTSCLQVLASFMVYAKENEISIEWEQKSDVVLEAACLTGLSKLLNLND